MYLNTSSKKKSTQSTAYIYITESEFNLKLIFNHQTFNKINFCKLSRSPFFFLNRKSGHSITAAQIRIKAPKKP